MDRRLGFNTYLNQSSSDIIQLVQYNLLIQLKAIVFIGIYINTIREEEQEEEAYILLRRRYNY